LLISPPKSNLSSRAQRYTVFFDVQPPSMRCLATASLAACGIFMALRGLRAARGEVPQRFRRHRRRV
jgi:hypothetical protein